MDSIENAVSEAGKIGRYAAESDDTLYKGAAVGPATSVHHPGDDTGRLALEAYRVRGKAALRSVIQAYQDGYNDRAKELGNGAVSWEQIKGGIGWALPGATDEEQQAIATAL